MSDLVPVERIEGKIYLIRGQKVMLDFDLAELYGVETRTLNQAVRRNIERFPEDFMFQLTWDEVKRLRSQIVILEQSSKSEGKQRLKSGRGKYAKYLPFAFTEQGIAMLSSVLRSKQAIKVNIIIMRAFVRIRQILSSHKELLKKMENLERKTDKNTGDIQLIFKAIRKMLMLEEKPKKRIGFKVDQED